MKEAFNKYFIDIIKNHYLDFQGKMDNKTFSFFFLNWLIIYFLVVTVAFSIPLFQIIFNTDINLILLAVPMMIMVVISVYLLIPCFCACLRRQRDIDEKKWFLYCLLLLIPFIGNIVYIVVLCSMPSEKKETIKQIEN